MIFFFVLFVYFANLAHILQLLIISQRQIAIKHLALCILIKLRPPAIILYFMAKKAQKGILSLERTKSLMRQAFAKRPKSIEQLKRSLSINHNNLQEFIRYIRQPLIFQTQARHKDENGGGELSDFKHLAENIRNTGEKRTSKKQIFLKRSNMKDMKRKQIKHEANFKMSNVKLEIEDQIIHSTPRHLQKKAQSVRNKRVLTSHVQNHSEYRKLSFHQSHKETENSIKSKQELRNTYYVGYDWQDRGKSCTNTQRFWKIGGKGMSTTNRWRTQSDQKTGEKTLCDLTRFDQKQNKRQLNFLALQLQINIEKSRGRFQTEGRL